MSEPKRLKIAKIERQENQKTRLYSEDGNYYVTCLEQQLTDLSIGDFVWCGSYPDIFEYGYLIAKAKSEDYSQDLPLYTLLVGEAN